MPQLVGKAHFFIKFGGFEPSTGVHFPEIEVFDASSADLIADVLAPFFNTALKIVRWETRSPDGSFITSGALNHPGTNLADFDDFRDCNHIQWASGGAQRPSGMFLPGRCDNHWNQGNIQPELTTRVNDLLAVLRSLGASDSEGFSLNDVRRISVSRRRRMRVAP
jgi:hypothetical protein